jgi:hypothetical protein
MSVLMSTRRNGFVTNFYNLMKEICAVVLYKFIHTLHILNFTDSEEEVKAETVTRLIYCGSYVVQSSLRGHFGILQRHIIFLQLRGNNAVNQVAGREINVLPHLYRQDSLCVLYIYFFINLFLFNESVQPLK